MGRLLQTLHDIFYFSTVRLGGINFRNMEYGAEEWRVRCSDLVCPAVKADVEQVVNEVCLCSAWILVRLQSSAACLAS